MCQINLFAHWHEIVCKDVVIFSQQSNGDHEVVNVAEYKGAFFGIGVLGFDETERVVAPVTAGVEVVRSVIAIIEAMAVAL